MTAGLEFRDLVITRGGRDLVRGASLSVGKGAIGAILGPSGAGKTSILRAIAGLAEPDSGTIVIDGVTMFGKGRAVPPEHRRVGMLFQGFALWPHMTAREHLTFALRGGDVPRDAWDHRIDEVAGALGLDPLLLRRPGALSGGERQRLSLARALVTRPAVLLLDEPTASLDPGTARDVLAYVQDLVARFGTTSLLVTHDQQEAMALAQHLLVLDRGVALQSGPPAELYANPASPRVATFLGDGVLVAAHVRGGRADTVLGPVPVAAGTADGRGRLLVRPERLSLAGPGASGVVVRRAFRGASFRLAIEVGDEVVSADSATPVDAGARVTVRHVGIAPFFPEASS